MTQHTAISFLDLPIDAKRRVDSVCRDFERSASPLRIEDCLPRIESELRSALFSELLALELERRRIAGETPTISEYLQRFEEMQDVVRMVFGQAVPAVGGYLGKYHLTGILGRGGMGVVYEAVDPVINRAVAIKVLPERFSADPQARDRLIREARLAGQVLHPNVVTLFEVGEAEGVTYLVLERLTGGSIADRIKRDGPLEWKLASRIAADVCRGLAAIHDAGFLHLDIKPANILLPAPREASESTSVRVLAKLTDFSLSAAALSTPGLGVIQGTPAYMSPEQRDGVPLTQRTDLFGVGAAYFAMLTGQAPFVGSSVTEVMADQLLQPTPNPRSVISSLPESVVRIVRRAMAVRPEDRYSSATEMLTDLEAAVAPRRRWQWRDVAAAFGGAAAMLALAGAITLMASSPGPLEPAKPAARLDRIEAWEPLLDDHDLTSWTPLVPDGGTRIGLGPQSQFNLVELDGLPVVRSTGTGQGSIESPREYENYHLRFEYRWATATGDHKASIRYHCTGPIGSKGTHGMELHLQDAGKYLRLNDLLKIDVGQIRGARVVPVEPGGQSIPPQRENEAPVARWNKAALICVGDWSVHVINGVPALALARSRRANDEPLTRGRIRFQSVKGEIFFRKIEIRRITELPPEYQINSPDRE